MAQPVFDDHPLERYLREAGEARGMMPGGSFEYTFDSDEEEDAMSEDGEVAESCPSILNELFDSIATIILPESTSALIERFKYSVISSSLLSPSLSPPQSHRRVSAEIPGNLHSRSPSFDPFESKQRPLTPTPTPIHSHSLTSDSQYTIASLALALLTVFYSAGYYISCVSICAFLVYIFATDQSAKPAMTPSLDALNDLISAGNVWDSIIQEAMTIIEKDEKHMIYSSITPSSPFSSLRVALHSTLLTTQTQCDNVRQLLSALTSHSELSQLSGMYAPPSPGPSTNTSPNAGPRPFSLPSRRRTSSNPTPMDESKRYTWNGFYGSLANAGSPTSQILKRREKRRSDLTALLQATTSFSHSAPVSPNELSLEGVAEEEKEEGSSSHLDQNEQFGLAALELQRKRKLGGLETLGLSRPPSIKRHSSSHLSIGAPSDPPPLGRRSPLMSPRSPLSPLGNSGSRYTSKQAPRHPLSLSSLHLALQAALSSKRYACSHLLALRFTEEKDDHTYWEDVRSVMGLLTTTFADASARLMQALESVERARLVDEQPTPAIEMGDRELEDGNVFERQQRMHQPRESSRSRSRRPISFAPMPSHLSRFAAHVDAISSALNDAREHLEECVSKLKEEEDSDSSRGRRRSLSPLVDEGEDNDTGHPALLAYERLRRELGLALRECERGREKLLDVVHPSRLDHPDDDDADHLHDLPSFGHDGTDESDDKPEIMEYDGDSQLSPKVTIIDSSGGHSGVDDATSHLLSIASSEHLPPVGAEQVYEGDSGAVGPFTRERSKLSREERIQLSKKARETGKSFGGIRSPTDSEDGHRRDSGGMEMWGPGGEVVQELKDVIWKVGEKRRKMTDGHVPADTAVLVPESTTHPQSLEGEEG